MLKRGHSLQRPNLSSAIPSSARTFRVAAMPASSPCRPVVSRADRISIDSSLNRLLPNPTPGLSSPAGRWTGGWRSLAGAGLEQPVGRRTSTIPPHLGGLAGLCSGRSGHRLGHKPAAIDRVSFYCCGLFFWPERLLKLGFQAIIDGNSHPFRWTAATGTNAISRKTRKSLPMDSASPDGRKIAYHKSYQVYVADADGSTGRSRCHDRKQRATAGRRGARWRDHRGRGARSRCAGSNRRQRS